MTIKPSHLTLCTLLSIQFSIFSSALFAQSKGQVQKPLSKSIEITEHSLATWATDQENRRYSLKERMEKYKVNGLSIVVIKDYKIAWAKGYGWADVDQKKPVDTKTLFQAGSISKSLNGVGILKLVQEGKLDLYKDINDYLVSWKFPYDSLSKGKKITTANLLSHTAGLSGHGFGGYMKGEAIPSVYDILDGKKPANSEAVRSMYEPGKTAEYSGGGITISQLMLTDITGKKYEDYMLEQVLQPLGMSESFFSVPTPNKKNLLASGYYPDGKKANEGGYNFYPEMAAASLWTNPTDLAKYIIETQLSLKGKSAKVLSQKMTMLRLNPYIDNESALGVFIKQKGNERYFTHSGGTKGFISEYIGSFENGNGVVVMTNGANPGIAKEIFNSVALAYNWKDFYKPEITKTISLPLNLMQKYVGNYQWQGKPVAISIENGQLWLNAAVKSRLYFTADTEFYLAEREAHFKFNTAPNGLVDGFVDTEDNRKIEKVK